jgi:pyruvate/2-oxoglutarate dehydrogenase complex dihydrolipoamide dehydrogenase (E3) component
VGLSEREARQRGISVRVATLPMTAILRTRTIDESAGFMKVLVERAGDRILGFTMIGPEAGEVMAAVQTAMLGGLPPLCSLAGRDPHPPHDGGRTGQPLRRRSRRGLSA